MVIKSTYKLTIYYFCSNSTRTHTISELRQGLLLSPSRFVVILDGFLFIFASTKPNTPLIQAHFVGSFRPVARFVVILAAGFFYLFSLL